MSVRVRAWFGATLVAVGVILLGAAALMTKVENGVARSPVSLFWAGLGLAVAGIGVVLWALRDVVRQLGQNQSRFETQMRAEVQEKKGRDPSG